MEPQGAPPPGGSRRALLVLKPVPVPEVGGDPVPYITRRLAQVGLRCEVALTRPDAPAQELVRRALASGAPPDLVIAAGGDGTHGPAGAALAGTGVPLALIPLGTFNNFARSLGIPRALGAALDVIAAGRRRLVDAGRVNGRLFFEVAGAGWDATLFPAGESLKRGNLGAALSAAGRVLRYRTDEIALVLDGRREVVSRTPTVVVANGPYFGSSFAVAPTSRLDDGLLTVTLFEGFGRAELLAHFAAIAEGQARSDPRIVSHRAARVEVSSPPDLPAHADGEPLGPLASPFEALPGALAVLAPPRAPAGALRSTIKWTIPAPPGAAPPARAARAASQTMRWQAPAPDAPAVSEAPDAPGRGEGGPDAR
jgi:YegS/Rv2252/BmrU family lipid kinase